MLIDRVASTASNCVGCISKALRVISGMTDNSLLLTTTQCLICQFFHLESFIWAAFFSTLFCNCSVVFSCLNFYPLFQIIRDFNNLYFALCSHVDNFALVIQFLLKQVTTFSNSFIICTVSNFISFRARSEKLRSFRRNQMH